MLMSLVVIILKHLVYICNYSLCNVRRVFAYHLLNLLTAEQIMIYAYHIVCNLSINQARVEFF